MSGPLIGFLGLAAFLVVGAASQDYNQNYTTRTFIQTRPAVCEEYDVTVPLLFGMFPDHRRETTCHPTEAQTRI